MTAAYRVGIDGFNLALTQGTGVATYARGLCSALRSPDRAVDLIFGLDVPGSASAPLRETLFFERLGEGRSGGEAPAGRMTLRRAARQLFLSSKPRDLIEVPRSGRVIAGSLSHQLPPCDRLFTLGSLFYLGARHFRRHGRFLTVRMPDPPALMHWTYPVPVRLAGARNLYTIHDLVPLRLPYLSLEDKAYHEAMLRQCAREADHIITVSETSRRDLIDHLDIDPARITNSYQALPDVTDDLGEGDASIDAARLSALFGLEPQGYFLFVGAIEPKKNVGRLIEAYLASGVRIPLVLAGPAAWQAERELRLIHPAQGSRLPAAERIRRIDYLPRDQLRLLMGGARALLSPSLYEGFGLPALEAMTLGVPVMASNTGSLSEIVGSDGLLVCPYDSAAMAEMLRQLDGDDLLRARLVRGGELAARRFSMAAYRARLDSLHASLLSEPLPAIEPSRPTFPENLRLIRR